VCDHRPDEAEHDADHDGGDHRCRRPRTDDQEHEPDQKPDPAAGDRSGGQGPAQGEAAEYGLLQPEAHAHDVHVFHRELLLGQNVHDVLGRLVATVRTQHCLVRAFLGPAG
jgi:hypothetical protein